MTENKPRTPAFKGFLITIVLLIVGLGIYLTGKVEERIILYCLYGILFVGVTISSVFYARQMNGRLTFGNIFAEGFKTTAVIIVLSSICTFISLKFIVPEMVDKIIEAGRAQMKAQGGSTEEQVKQYFDGMNSFMVPIIIGYIIFFFGIIGALASLTGAALAKKNLGGPIAQ